MVKPPIKEAEVLKGCLDWLSAKNVFHFRVNNTGIYDPTRKAFRSFQGTKGIPDIIAIVPQMTSNGCMGVFCGIEVKSPKGRLSAAQEAIQDEINQSGGIAMVVRSVEELAKDFKEIGL